MSAIKAALFGFVAALLAAFGGLLWWRKGEAIKAAGADAKRAHARADQARVDAEAAAVAVVAAVDAEAERKIEEARHGGATALRDAIAGRH